DTFGPADLHFSKCTHTSYFVIGDCIGKFPLKIYIFGRNLQKVGVLKSLQINNLVIAQMLRGVQKQQDENYRKAVASGQNKPTSTMILIEEAHEFLSAERIRQMPVLFQQVARIAKRDRKRWLGLG